MTLVGLDVTMMKAMLVAMPAGPARIQGFMPMSMARAMMRGMTTAPVTLLEEKKILSSSTMPMTARTRRTGCSSPTPESIPQASQRAAPVLASIMPAEMPPAMRTSPPQSMLLAATFQSSKTRRPGTKRSTKPSRATKPSGALKPM